MDVSIEKEKLFQEISLVPKEKLSELYDFIHYFRLGIEAAEDRSKSIMDFAGCWEDMPNKVFSEFTEEIAERRHSAFSGRRGDETSTD